MATVSNPLTNVVQEAFNLLPTQNAKSARAAQTATQNVTTQNTATDTVTLASQNVPAQAAGGTGATTTAQTAQPTEIIQYEQITVTAEEIIVTGGGNNGGGANANPGTVAAAATAVAAPATATPAGPPADQCLLQPSPRPTTMLRPPSRLPSILHQLQIRGMRR